MACKKSNRYLKSAFSTIETIIAIVLIGIIMLTIPKINAIMDRNHNFSSREDGILINTSLINYISLLDWDHQNSEFNDIMITSGSNPLLNCNVNRINNFINPRQCLENLSNSIVGPDLGETNSSNFYDVDDWNGYSIVSNWNGTEQYRTEAKVDWFDDTNTISYDFPNNKITIDLSLANAGLINTNIKKINVYTIGKNKNQEDILISNQNFYSSNIGKLVVESKLW